MKKTISAIALAAVMMLTTSAYDQSVVGVEKGDYAPSLSLANEQQSLSLQQLRGKYVVLTFWSSSDASSRAQCIKYDAWAAKNQESPVSRMSVNLDDNPQLFAEIAKADGLDTSVQFNVKGQEAKKIVDDFKLAEGFGTLLINPDGRVCEINPTISQLSSL